MRIRYAIVLLSLSLLITEVPSPAQVNKVFSGETGKYLGELSLYIQKNINPESEKILTDFITAWHVDSLFSANEQVDIVNTSRLLVAKNANPYPQFSNYLTCVIYFKRRNQTQENYVNWQKSLDSLLTDKKIMLQSVNKYLMFTKQLIDSSALCITPSHQWKINTGDYKFIYDSTARLSVEKTDLICISRNDSISIFETGGEYNPVTSLWQGKKGTVTWERAGFKRNDVHAVLGMYKIDMSRSEYKAENVVFTDKNYFNKSLQGFIVDKVKHNKFPEDADYPQFNSYQKNFSIKNLYKDINYEGGLSVQGSKLIGTGGHDKQARIDIFRKDTLVIIAKSYYFAFKANRIDAPNAEIVIRLKKDSIYHPGLGLSYLVATRELSLYRTDNFVSKSPYFNSYHNIDMSFEQLTWRMNEPVMRFGAPLGSTIGDASFESVNFFNENKYLSMQGMDEVHPLVSIRSFARHMGSNEFLVDDYADYLKKSISQVKQMLMRMAVMGFIYYDTETGMAKIRPRLNDFIASSVSKIDYDVISFPSRTRMPVENAIFDLRNYDLTINGIPQIFVSDSQNVAIFPRGAKIIMKKNRSFQFSGVVRAGLFTFSGKNFFFDYDSFKIGMKKIDSLHIRYLTGQLNNYGFKISAPINTLIQDLTGDLYIDKPDNKSGRNSYPQYPIFHSKDYAYVYYDRKDIQNGVYNRNRFFFRVNPFEMDSLDNFNRQAMKFDGRLVSADIFPAMEETLRLQPDSSLGFRHFTAEEGLPLYKGKGSFINEIDLSNHGFLGKGTIKYLTSTLNSDEIYFYPDSLNATALDFTIAQKTSETQYPWVSSGNNNIHWVPYSDELYAYHSDRNFKMFNDSTVLAGDLKLQPTGLTGSGRMVLKGAELQSDLYEFKAQDLYADTADFNLKSLHSEGFTVLTENMYTHINFAEQKGYFKSNEAFTLVSFPENKYVSYLDNFEWDMKHKELAMGSMTTLSPASETAEEGLTGPRYICIDPKQDSLSFISPKAYYNYDSNLIKATDVKYIDIADARIYPDKGRLVVQPNAMLRTLTNAKILANRDTRYFNFYNATINISGKNNYAASADYDYIDELKQAQVIHFKTVAVDSGGHTVGAGVIIEPDHFTLSPNYKFQGKVSMAAVDKLLTFEGGALIEDNCDLLKSKWVNFKSEIDPQNIFIPISDPLIDINRNKIFNGLYMYYDSVHVYPAFLSARKNYSDKPLVTSGGFLYYDKKTQQYNIGSKDKIQNPDMPGNLVTLHRENCDLYGEGVVNLGANLGQVKLTTVGNAQMDINKNEVEMDVVLGMDFYIADNIIDVMAAEIDSMPDLPAVDLNRPVYTKGIVDLIGKPRFDALKSELSLFGSVKVVPPELKHTLMFNELKLKWDNETNSWISVGKIGIASINNTQINKRVNGLFQLQIKRSGDICDIYLQMDRRTWYYFGYTRGVMQIHSSNTEFLDKIEKLKPNERRLKVNTGESYIYMVATDAKKNGFYRKFRDIQEGNDQENNGK